MPVEKEMYHDAVIHHICRRLRFADGLFEPVNGKALAHDRQKTHANGIVSSVVDKLSLSAGIT